MRILSAGLLVALFYLTAPAALALDIPPALGYVNDRANLLQPASRQQLEHFLEEFERSDSTQIAVLTIPSLQGEPIDDYALRVAETWGIGKKGRDNGALLLIAHQDRRVRIEVGYGLEGRLTDLLAGRIIDNEIVPRFKEGDYNEGILAGVQAIVNAVRGEYKGTASTKRKQRNPLGFILLLLFFGPGLLRIFSHRGSRHRNYRRGGFYVGGSGGGGFSGGGFGGGGFGGGGASGSW